MACSSCCSSPCCSQLGEGLVQGHLELFLPSFVPQGLPEGVKGRLRLRFVQLLIRPVRKELAPQLPVGLCVRSSPHQLQHAIAQPVLKIDQRAAVVFIDANDLPASPLALRLSRFGIVLFEGDPRDDVARRSVAAAERKRRLPAGGGDPHHADRQQAHAQPQPRVAAVQRVAHRAQRPGGKSDRRHQVGAR